MLVTGKAQAGFTLIEMLVVVAVAGLVGGLMFPRLQAGMAAQEFRSATSSVTLALKRARGVAIASGRVQRITVGIDGRSLSSSTGRLDLPRSVSAVSEPSSNLLFFADGTSTGGAIALSGAGRTVRLAVRPATGLVRMTAS